MAGLGRSPSVLTEHISSKLNYFTVTAGDPVPPATSAEPDESEGLAELNKGHGPGVTETGCTEKIVLLPLKYWECLHYVITQLSTQTVVSLYQPHTRSTYIASINCI